MPVEPLVSIVTATYNRSNILRYTIDAARASSLTDWEHLIVGDACTDDTAEVVAAYRDARLRFINLPRNVGEQSAANNEGCRLARGRYIAMLNHDDLWLPTHLQTAVTALEQTGVDLVFTLALAIDHRQRVHLTGVTPDGQFTGRGFVPSSSWVFRRSLMEEIGPWRRASTLYAAPSTEWLDRAYRAGKQIVPLPVATLLVITSGDRRNSYAERQGDEHARAASRLREDPQYVVSLLTSAAADLTRDQGRVRPLLARAARNAVAAALTAAGVSPLAVANLVRFRRRGGLVDRLRQTRGLGPLPREEG